MSKPALRIGAGKWGTKDGRLLGYFEGDTIDRYRPRHFTVTRGADINATRVNKKGLVEKGRENDLIRSNDFTGADWTSPSATLTGGQPGYDGTNDATLIGMTGQYGQATQTISKTLVQTLSVYVKANTLKWFRPYMGGPGVYAYFDLENGVTGAHNGLHSYMEDAGNGWWRCAFTFEGSITDVRLHPAKGNHDMTATSGGVFIQHAQLESGFSATPYIETGSKTNLINNSEEPVAGYWSVNGATITRGNDGDGFFSAGYDGTNDAWRLRSSNTSASNVSADVLDIAGKGEYTFSVYARAGSQKFLRMSLVENDENDAAFNSRVWVDLSKGVFTTVPSTAHIVSKDIQYITDGWYRIYLTFDIPADHEVTKVALYVTQATNNNTSALNDDIYIQHPQLEKGSRPTVYSPTISRAGVLEDQPRIDYSDNKAQLLLERDGRNLIKYSEGSKSLGGYDNSDADEANIFNVPGYINPTGHKGGVVRVTNLLGDGGDRLYASGSTTSGTKYNGSFYIKGEAGKKISFYTKRIQSAASEPVSTGTLVTNIDLTGDWQRVDQTITANSPSAAVFIVNRTSVDISTAKEVYVWGWQLEEGEYATSYLPNYGTTAGSTRTFDKVTFNPSTETTYNTSAYTYILDVNIPNEVTGTSPLWTDATDIANDGGFQLRQPDGNNMGITIHTGSSYQAFHSTAKTGRFKIAMRYASGTVEVFFNGTKHSGSYNVTGWDQSTNEYRFQNASRDNYKVNEFSYYAKALTDAECESLTTI